MSVSQDIREATKAALTVTTSTTAKASLPTTLWTASPAVTTTMMVTSMEVTTSTPSPRMSLAAGNITTSVLKLSMRETSVLQVLLCRGNWTGTMVHRRGSTT